MPQASIIAGFHHSLIGGTTLFASTSSTSKFTKEVGKIIHFLQDRRRRKIEKALSELFFYALQTRRHKNDFIKYSLTRRQESLLLKKYNQDSVNAARISRYASRADCMKRWIFLRKRKALPLNPATKRQWRGEDFDEFLQRIEATQAVYA